MGKNPRRILSDSEDDVVDANPNNPPTSIPPVLAIKKEKPNSLAIKKEAVTTRPSTSTFIIEKLFDPNIDTNTLTTKSASDCYSPTIECIDLAEELLVIEKNASKSNVESFYDETDLLDYYSDDDVFLKMFEDDGRLSESQIKKEPIDDSQIDDDEIELWSVSLSQTPTKREITDHSDLPLVITLDDDDDPEPEPEPEPEAPVIPANREKLVTESQNRVTDDADDQFWPELSQNFFDQDSEEENHEMIQKKKVDGGDRLMEITKSDRFKPPSKMIRTCSPKPLETHRRKGPAEFYARKPVRNLQLISPRRHSPRARRRTGKKNETKEKMKLTVEAGKTWIKPSSSSSKKSEISKNPVQAVGTGLSRKFDSNFVIPRNEKTAPPTVKAKTTASRNDLFVKDFINGGVDPKAGAAKPSDSDKVAKKRTEATKRKISSDDEAIDEDIAPTTSEYVPKKKRIARVADDKDSYPDAGDSRSSSSSKGKTLKKSIPNMDSFSAELIALGKKATVAKKIKPKKATAALPQPTASTSTTSTDVNTTEDAIMKELQEEFLMDADSSDAVTRTPEPSNAVLEPPNVSPSKGRSLGKSCLKLFPRRGPTKKAVIFNLEKNRTKIIEARSAVEMNPDPAPLPAVAPSPLP